MKIQILLAGVLALTIALPTKALTLSRAQQTWQIDPATLAISVQTSDALLLVNQDALSINDTPQQADMLSQSATQAEWRLLPSGVRVSATLEHALQLSFSWPQDRAVARAQPVSLNWFELAQQQSQTLLLPLDEGMRIPIRHAGWARYLTEHHSGSNTTQDLKMPFWSVQQGTRFISYHLTHPTNNQLFFSQSGGTLGMTARHQFTSLNQTQPFTLAISLGHHALDGAKAYRRWRDQQGLRQSLADKRRVNPLVEKLIGASHVYLFGRDLLAQEDVNDWWGLKNWYFRQPILHPSETVRQELTDRKHEQQWMSAYHRRLLVADINQALNRMISPAENGTVREQYLAAQQRKQWLTEQAGAYLHPPSSWGQGLSSKMVTTLQQAGLNQLWIGLDNWMPAFYQPQVVDQMKQAGYLLGVYDSYNTAIDKGVNDSWLTAQLPDEMRRECAIEIADGSKKTGFRGHGFYLNPACRMDYVQNRVREVLRYGRFNSLFLDVDATAMAREDYHAKSSESAMLQAFNQRMTTLATNEPVVLGSEDGNALTTTGIVFAHGMETVGFGWRDPAMTTQRQSPYFLGAWYPDEKPDFFFKSARVKPMYRELLFAPQFKVPLYQAVFHDEVINSHHWHTDSLKFSDVKTVRDLQTMLYNTPAMVHLSRDEASAPDSPRIRQLQHYQQIFAPLHQVLWDKALVDFVWLDTSGQVQQTRFSDGSQLTANFSAKAYELDSGEVLPGGTLLAQLSNGKTLRWRSLPLTVPPHKTG
ncbi:glycoside hydrolase [Vibrio proteolyticus]